MAESIIIYLFFTFNFTLIKYSHDFIIISHESFVSVEHKQEKLYILMFYLVLSVIIYYYSINSFFFFPCFFLFFFYYYY